MRFFKNWDKIDKLINLLMPVGVVLTFAADIDPNTVYSGTTWVLLKDTFLLGKGDTYTTLGATGGSADAVVVSHNHTKITAYGNSAWEFMSNTSLGGTHTVPYSILPTVTTYAGSKTTGGLATNTTGVSGTDKNMPPYTVVNFWKRTA